MIRGYEETEANTTYSFFKNWKKFQMTTRLYLVYITDTTEQTPDQDLYIPGTGGKVFNSNFREKNPSENIPEKSLKNLIHTNV